MDLTEISYSKALSRFNPLPSPIPIESVKNVAGDQTPVKQLSHHFSSKYLSYSSVVPTSMSFQEFVQTLDQAMVTKLCIRSLRRGIGSMDYIHGLLIMEDDLDDEIGSNEESVAPTPGTSTEEQMASTSDAVMPDPGPPPSNTSVLPWCKCGVCQIMPQEIENKCCAQQRCVTTHSRFSKLCLDPDVLQLPIRNRGDIRNNWDDNSTRAFRKAAYSQYVLDRYGYLGKGNRKVCPSCVVTVIRRHYPSQTGVYMGFRAD